MAGGGLGMLAGLAGGQGAAGAQSPEDLLAQIRALLEEYLALGPDTPVAAEAQSLMAAIDGGGAEGAPPADAMAGGDVPLPDESGLGGMDDPGMLADVEPVEDPGSYSDARSGAKDFLKKRKAKA